MIRAKRLVLPIATSLLVNACQSVPVEFFTCDLSLPNNPSSQSQPLNINIYVDGTPSMLGYVTHPKTPRTRYVKTIGLLEEKFEIGGQSKRTTQYYRLGETSEKINRDRYREARLPKFYDGRDTKFPPLKVSKIENAITPANDGKLTVIITDLYQANEDVITLNKKIEENYLSTNQKNYAVGILALKSEFNGSIYIEDGTDRKIPYNTNDDQGNPIKNKEFRPFYVIFLGQYSDIDYYFKNLSDSKDLPEDRRLIIFSPNNLVKELSYLQGYPNLPEGLNRAQSLNDGQVAVEVKDNKNEILEIEKNVTNDLSINYSIPVLPLSNALFVEYNSIEIDTKVKKFNLDKKMMQEESNSSLKNALELGQWQIQQNKDLKFVTTIKPSALPEPGIYLFTVDAVAKGVQEQDWWSEWSSSDNTSSDWKTYNLETFLKGLKRSTDSLMEKKPVAIGRFCYAIQKN